MGKGQYGQVEYQVGLSRAMMSQLGSDSVSRFGVSSDFAFTVILRPQAEESLDQTHLGKRYFAFAALRLRMTFPWCPAKLNHCCSSTSVQSPLRLRQGEAAVVSSLTVLA